MKRQDFTFRSGRVEDVDAIFAVHRAAARGAPKKFYDPDIIQLWSPDSSPPGRCDELIANLLSGDEMSVVAEDKNGKIVGFGSIFPKKNELRAVYVNPDYGRLGIGGQILAELEKMAKEEGLSELCMDSSLNAEKFYQAHGFVTLEHGEHKLASGRTMACLKMKKTLA